MKYEDPLGFFFSQHSSPVDIVLILDSALKYIQKLADYRQGDNLLFFRPKTSHRRQVHGAYLLGETHPDRTVLFLDEDMLEGNAIREAGKYFEQL